MESFELKKKRLGKEERDSIRENTSERESEILQSDLSEERKTTLIKDLRDLEEKSLAMSKKFSPNEPVEVELTNQSSDEQS
jgi:hypothetical protein